MFVKVALFFCMLLHTPLLGRSEQLKFVEKLNHGTTQSSTFWFLYRLYTVKKNETHLEISKTDENYENSEVQCTATLDPVKDHMVGRAKIVPGVYTMVVYGVNTSEVVDMTRKTQYTTLLVNHLNCTYGTISLPTQEVPVDFPVMPPMVRNNIYGFDFFYPNKNCSPCHVFTESGVIKSKNQLKVDSEKPSKPMLLKTARWPNKSPYGYFYAYNFNNGTAVVKFLSKEYEVIREKYVNHPIDAADVSYAPVNETTFVGFCYGNGTQEVYCGQFDDDLKIRSVYRLTLLADTYVSGMTVKVNKKGRLMIGLAQSPFKTKDKKHLVTVFIYDMEGNLIETGDAAKINYDYQYFDLDSWFYDYGHRQEYCIHVTGTEVPDSIDAYEVVKCLFWNEIHKILS